MTASPGTAAAADPLRAKRMPLGLQKLQASCTLRAAVPSVSPTSRSAKGACTPTQVGMEGLDCSRRVAPWEHPAAQPPYPASCAPLHGTQGCSCTHTLQVTSDHGLPEWDAGTTTLKQGHYSPLHRAAAHGLRCSMPGAPHDQRAASGAKAEDTQQKHSVLAVVPPGALEIIVRTMFCEQALLQTAQRIKLLKQYEVLRELGFTGGLRMSICGTFIMRFAVHDP